MEMYYVYLKLTDKGKSGQTLYWDGDTNPEDFVIKEAMMKMGSSGLWEVTLQRLGERGFDLVSVVPHESINSDNHTIMENIYVFKRKHIV